MLPLDWQRQLREAMRREAREYNLGPTGEPPRSHIDNDEGPFTAALSIRDNRVVLNFGKLLEFVIMTPAQARTLAATLVAAADLVERT